jgi:RNA polymerase sporulation-specific sigma factor
MTDVELVLLARGGDEVASERLVRRYRGFVRLKASSYFLLGGESDDLIQEGLLGLYKAIRDYRTDRESSFRNFAELCITRQIITAVKTATRNKHTPLNSAASLNQSVGADPDGDTMLEEVVPDPLLGVADRVALRDEIADLGDLIRDRLTDRECAVLLRRANGYDYQEIAAHLGMTVKAVDCALTKARWKLAGESPASRPKAFEARPRGIPGYACPACGGATRKKRKGPGRPPRCNVCRVSAPDYRLSGAAA